MPPLFRFAGTESVDLLKIDIEGSELEVFNVASRSWLPKVKNICIELHGDECRKALMTALDGSDYEISLS